VEVLGTKDVINPQISSYLGLNRDRGRPKGAVMVSRGAGHKCLIIPNRFYSYGFLTDGEYIWTIVFAEYYDTKAIRLPKDFLAKMEFLNYIVPEPTDEQVELFEATIDKHFYPHPWDNPFGFKNGEELIAQYF
jgi:hypothetical protein